MPDRQPAPPDCLVNNTGNSQPALGAARIHLGDCLDVIRDFPSASFDLIYLDPPFNTGRAQSRTRMRTTLDENGERIGYRGRRYRSHVVGTSSFNDRFDNFSAFIQPRLQEAYRLLKPDGSFFLHMDYREVHYCKIMLDGIFGRDSFINEIVWSYDYGARSRSRWSAKHDNILWYARNPRKYTYRHEDIDRIPYMAPGLVSPEKAKRGKTPTDVWWQTIVSPNGKEKTGYPTQKPLAILNRIIRVHSNPGDRVLDFLAGSGTTGEAAIRAGRDVVLVDVNPEAFRIMCQRLEFANPAIHGGPRDSDHARSGSSDTGRDSPARIPAPGT